MRKSEPERFPVTRFPPYLEASWHGLEEIEEPRGFSCLHLACELAIRRIPLQNKKAPPAIRADGAFVFGLRG